MNVEDIEKKLDAREIGIKEAQRLVAVLLNAREPTWAGWVSPNERESAVRKVDNELELIIYTLKPESQHAAVASVMAEVKTILERDAEVANNS